MEIEKEEMKEVVKEAVLEAAKSMQNSPSQERGSLLSRISPQQTNNQNQYGYQPQGQNSNPATSELNPNYTQLAQSRDVNIRAAKNGYLLQVGYRDTFVFTHDQKQQMLDKIIENLK